MIIIIRHTLDRIKSLVASWTGLIKIPCRRPAEGRQGRQWWWRVRGAELKFCWRRQTATCFSYKILIFTATDSSRGMKKRSVVGHTPMTMMAYKYATITVFKKCGRQTITNAGGRFGGDQSQLLGINRGRCSELNEEFSDTFCHFNCGPTSETHKLSNVSRLSWRGNNSCRLLVVVNNSQILLFNCPDLIWFAELNCYADRSRGKFIIHWRQEWRATNSRCPNMQWIETPRQMAVKLLWM